jgi:hypothetical protein
MRKTLIVALSLVALLGASTVAQAACRPESGLACNQVVDPAGTKVFQTGPNKFAITFVLTSRVQFLCNSSLVPLPGSCPKDGITQKPEISANLASVIQSSQLCTVFEGTTTRSGATSFGFRVRFEQNNSPKRKTCILRFTMPADYPGQSRALAFTLENSLNVAPEE